MFIDIIFLLLMAMAIYKGYSRGFIVAVFSFFACIIGLAAALKLSAMVAQKLHEKMNVSSYFLPVISFALVFAAVVLIIRWAAKFIRKIARLAFLGWVDTFLGIMLYAALYLLVYSVILFYATKINFISSTTQAASISFSFVEPLAPGVINGIGNLLPFFSNMFADLSKFFENVSRKGSS